MQTSSNFFKKNLLTLDDDSFKHKKKDKYHESHIVQDPLRLKDQLTPWTEINPKYNFHTQRLVRFKQNDQDQLQLGTGEQDAQTKRQVKPDVISNLFNFYKNKKQTKKSTLNNAKRKSKQKDVKQDNSWSLPPIDDKIQLEQELIENIDQNSKVNTENKTDSEKQNQKAKVAFIESISIREYLKKLKQKEKIFASPSSDDEKSKKQNQQKQQFISKRFIKNKSKEKLSNSINLVRQARKQQINLSNLRYAPIRNPQTYSAKKKSFSTQFQSLQQSFQLYKKAAQREVQESSNTKKKLDQSPKQINFMLAQKSLFKNNVPLSTLFSSINISTIDSSKVKNGDSSPLKKFNTISYETPFSPTSERSLLLPKVSKNFSYHK